MRAWGKEPQCVLTLPLLVGTDGVEKMSKSLNNAIGVTESPNEIFGKVMSVSDAAMWAYWTLLTDRRPAEIEEMRAAVAGGTLHPKKLKMDLGLQIVSDFHGQAAAFAAQEEFERRFAGAGGAVNAEDISLSGSWAPRPVLTTDRRKGISWKGIWRTCSSRAGLAAEQERRAAEDQGRRRVASRGRTGVDEGRFPGRHSADRRGGPLPSPRQEVREGREP